MKNNSSSKKPKPPVITIMASVAIVIMAALIIFGFFQRNTTGDYLTTEVVEEKIQEYLSSYESLSELDIKILTNNLSKQLDDQIANLNLGDLSEDDLREIMKLVNNELQYAEYAIPEDELYQLTVNIVKSIMASGHYESEDYESVINELAEQLEALQRALKNIDLSNLTFEDIQNIVNRSGLDENTVKNWISKTAEEGRDYTDQRIRELAKQLGIDEETLKQLIKESLEHEDSLTYLANKLDITINKLNSLFAQYNITDLNELYAYMQQMEERQANLQKQIEYNLSVVTSSITYVSNQITENKRATDAKIEANREATDARIDENRVAVDTKIDENQKATDAKIDENIKATDAKIDENKAATDTKIDENQKATDAKIDENKKETDAKIDENKAFTDRQIKELRDNVLFYQYDGNNNTLYLFEREE